MSGNIVDKPKDAGWEVSETSSTTDDPLLQCLTALTQLHNNPFSAASLTAGLPLVDNKLTPELFERAAARAGLSARVVKRPLRRMSRNLLPAVLLLKKKQACILIGLTKDKKAKVIRPETGTGVQEVPLAWLKNHYCGFSIFTQPHYKIGERTDEVQKPREQRWFWGAVQNVLPIYSNVLVASVLINAFAIAMPLFVMNVYDRVVPNHALETLWMLAIGIFIVICFDFIMKMLRSYFIDNASKQVDTELSTRIFEQIVGIKMGQRPRSVGVMANTVHLYESFKEFITSATISVLVDLPFVFLFLAVVYFVAGPVVVVPLLMIPMVILVGLLLQRPLNALVQESYRHASEKQATLIETLTNIETVMTNNAQGPMQRKWEQAVCLGAALNVKLKLLSSTGVTFTAFAQQITTVLLVIFGVYRITEGELTMGGLIAATILTGRAMAPMSQVAGLLTRYHQAKSALDSLDGIMNMPVERPQGTANLHRARLKGDIVFKHVNFKYPNEQVGVLNDVSFTVKQGEKVALIGRVGSGKTTIEKMIMGLYPPDSGSILIDGTEIQQIDTSDLRHNIGYVPQDIDLFYGSIKENIVIGAPYVSDEQVLQAATIAGVDQFTATHPQGFDRQVGERGCQLSGGQRQCISIARAVLIDPPILIMDEPTNLMDDKTEMLFKAQLDEKMQDKTLIVITHKASLLSLVDRLIVIDGGRIVADGNKDAVLKALSEGKIKPA